MAPGAGPSLLRLGSDFAPPEANPRRPWADPCIRLTASNEPAVWPARDIGGLPAANAPKHRRAKSIVRVETVLSFKPRTSFASGAADRRLGARGAASETFRRRARGRREWRPCDPGDEFPLGIPYSPSSHPSRICGDFHDRASGRLGRDPSPYFFRKRSTRSAISWR
jgi:hypothetical protein